MKAPGFIHGLMVAVLAVTAAAPVMADITSTFDTDADGWTLAPGHDRGSTLTYAATAGNPGGCVEFNDAAGGAADEFLAPAKFLGDDSGYYDGSLNFLLADDASSDSDLTSMVTITDADGNALAQPFADFTRGGYVQFGYALNENGGWFYYPAGSTKGSTPTRAEFQAVLGKVSSLVIRADFHSGTEHTFLDNVVLSTTPLLPIVTVTTSVGRTTDGSDLPAQVVFTRAGTNPDLSGKLVVYYAIKGTAVNGTDYYALSGKTRIKPGKVSRRINITAKGLLSGTQFKTVKLLLKPSPDGTYTVGTANKAKVKIYRD